MSLERRGDKKGNNVTTDKTERLAKILYINSSDIWFWPTKTSDQYVRDVRRERSNILRKATVERKVQMDMILVYQAFQV